MTRGARSGAQEAGEAELAQQRERLATLAALEEGLLGLREREIELEVESIAADAAIRNTEPGEGHDAEAADAVVAALDQVRKLEGRVDALAPAGNRTKSLESARDALLGWLEAPDAPRTRLPVGVQAALAIAAVAIVTAAVVIHLAFLLLLVPLGAVTALMWQGDDLRWRRQGTRQRFEQSELSPPRSWDELGVRERLQSLDEAIAQAVAPADATESAEPSDLETLDRLREEARNTLETRLAEQGIATHDDLDESLEQRLRLLSHSHRVRSDLRALKRRLKSDRVEAEDMRTGLLRFLTAHDAAPAAGHTDVGAISDALEGVARRGAVEHQR